MPGGLHRHPRQEERFQVIGGQMRFRRGRDTIVAGPGDVVVVPAGVRHDFANAGGENALIRVDVRPALNMERLFEVAVGLAQAKRRTEEFTATELADDEKLPLLRAYLKKWAWEVGAFFQGVGADAPDEDLRRIAPLHPIFRISRHP